MLALRERRQRNFLATLFCSRGVPLLLGGDEMGRTQGGNNNAYCQDNPVSWFDWSEARRNDPLIGFTQALVALRRELPVLRENRFPSGEPDEVDRRELAWYSVWGLPMTEEEWTNPAVRCIAALFDGRFSPAGGRASPSVLLLFNASYEPVVFTLPEIAGLAEWRVRVDTGQGHFPHAEAERVEPLARIELEPHAMAVLVEGRTP